MITVHEKNELETILKKTGNNCDKLISYGNNKYNLYNYIGCLSDIVEELNINTEKNYITMSDILEYNTFYQFDLIYFNQKHGSFAAYCLESIPTKKHTIRLNKPHGV